MARKIYYIWKCPLPNCNCQSKKPTAHYLARRYATLHGKRTHDMIIEPIFEKINLEDENYSK